MHPMKSVISIFQANYLHNLQNPTCVFQVFTSEHLSTHTTPEIHALPEFLCLSNEI